MVLCLVLLIVILIEVFFNIVLVYLCKNLKDLKSIRLWLFIQNICTPLLASLKACTLQAWVCCVCRWFPKLIFQIKKTRWNSYADHIQCLTTAICNDKKILKIVTFLPLTNVLFHLMRKTTSQHANVRTGSKYFSVIVATYFSFVITLFCLLKLYVNISFYFVPSNCLFLKQNP